MSTDSDKISSEFLTQPGIRCGQRDYRLWRVVNSLVQIGVDWQDQPAGVPRKFTDSRAKVQRLLNQIE